MRWDDFRRSEQCRGRSRATARRAARHAGRRAAGSASAPSSFSAWSAGLSASIRACCSTARKFFPAAARPRSRAASRRRSTPARRPTRPAILSPRCSAIPRTAGPKFSPRMRADLSSAAAAAVLPAREPTAAAAWRNRRWGRSIARRTSSIYLDIVVLPTTCSTSSAPARASKACQFSEAYVIAHEVGHHVQDELGILPQVTQAQQAASSKTEANALQVRVELQADCFAGVWANRAQKKHNFLDPGDVDQALQTASAIGDDRLQKETQGYVVPDTSPTAPRSSASAGSPTASMAARFRPAIRCRRCALIATSPLRERRVRRLAE